MKNLDQLDQQYRRLADDLVQPYLCDKDEIRDYFNEAIVEACRRSKFLVTSDPSVGETQSTATINFTSGSSGSIDSIFVGQVNILSQSIPFTSSLSNTLIAVANNINATGIYSALVGGVNLQITSPVGSGSSNNLIYPIVNVSAGSDIVCTPGYFTGGIDGICRISLKPNKYIYNYSDKIIQIKRAELGSTQRKIWSIDYRMLDEKLPSWRTKTGTPRWLVYGMESNAFRVFNNPTTADTINLTVTYLPLTELVYGEDVPPIPERYHDKLVSWVLYRVYCKNDTQVKQGVVNLAKKSLMDFEAEFGGRDFNNAHEEQFQLIHAEFNSNGSY